MKKTISILFVALIMLSCRRNVVKGEGYVGLIEKDANGCRCWVSIPKSSENEQDHWFECPEKTSVGDTLVFVWK